MSSNLKYWYLKDHQLFQKLSYDEIDALCILKRFKRSNRNEIVELPPAEKERLYFLKKGTLKLLRINSEGEEVLLEILQKGDIFGEFTWNQQDKEVDFIKVVSDEAIICTFFREKLEEVMLQKPDFALTYIKVLGFNFKKLQNSYKNILFKDAKTRLLMLLDSIIEKEGLPDNQLSLPNYLTQKDIAQLICITRQTVVSLFKELEQDAVLNYSQKQITIIDRQKIKNLIANVK
jgi:CRP/FNR family transcriptional regulator